MKIIDNIGFLNYECKQIYKRYAKAKEQSEELRTFRLSSCCSYIENKFTRLKFPDLTSNRFSTFYS